MRAKSTKHQAPSSTEAPIPKLQAPIVENWNLKFLWSLVLGAWCFLRHLTPPFQHSFVPPC